MRPASSSPSSNGECSGATSPAPAAGWRPTRRPGFLALFKTIVLDHWKARHADVAAQKATAERKIADVKRRKEQLLEAFIYQRLIDEGTYKDQMDKLNEALVMAEIDQHDQRSEELDIEAVLGFAERVSLNAPRLWLEASLDQRQRFQSFLFPEGIQVADGVLRTPATASFYEELHSFTRPEERMVDQLRGSWNLLLSWLRDVQAWSLEAEAGE